MGLIVLQILKHFHSGVTCAEVGCIHDEKVSEHVTLKSKKLPSISMT